MDTNMEMLERINKATGLYEENKILKEQVRIMKIDCMASLNWRIGKEAQVKELKAILSHVYDYMNVENEGVTPEAYEIVELIRRVM